MQVWVEAFTYKLPNQHLEGMKSNSVIFYINNILYRQVIFYIGKSVEVLVSSKRVLIIHPRLIPVE